MDSGHLETQGHYQEFDLNVGSSCQWEGPYALQPWALGLQKTFIAHFIQSFATPGKRIGCYMR